MQVILIRLWLIRFILSWSNSRIRGKVNPGGCHSYLCFVSVQYKLSITLLRTIHYLQYKLSMDYSYSLWTVYYLQ